MAKPKGMREVRRVRSEADLEPFRETDPYMLESTLHGAARFGWVQHLWRAGMLATDEEWEGKARGCPLTGLRFTANEQFIDTVVHWPYEGHRLIVGTPGSGKFTAAIAPALLEDDGCNAVVIDPKGGEALRWTGLYRDRVGRKAGAVHGVRALDPCGLFPGLKSESINPLEFIDLRSRNFVSEVDKLIDALVVTSGEDHHSVWTMSAKKVLRGLILHFLTRGGRTPTLLDVQQEISRGLQYELLAVMEKNMAADGLVSRCAMEISDLKVAENTWRGVKFQLDANLAFLDHLGVRRSLGSTSFDLLDLRRRRLSLYVTLPNKDKEALGRWLRLMYATIVDRIADAPGRGVHVIVDEFAALGRFERVPADLATARAAQLRFHVAVQDLNQLHETYGQGWQTIVGNCAVRQFLSINDNFTAEYVSRSLGPTTLKDGYDYQSPHPDEDPVPKPRFVGRELMTPGEIMGMPRERMLLFADRAERPFNLLKAHYYKTAPWGRRAADLYDWLGEKAPQ